MLKHYRKTPPAFNQQLALVKQRGMAFNDLEAEVVRCAQP